MVKPNNVTLSESADHLRFENGRIAIEISKGRGEWRSFAFDGRELINYQIAPQVPVDIKVDDEWQIETRGCRYLGFDLEEKTGHSSLHVHLGVGMLPLSFGVPTSLLSRAPKDRHEYLLTCTYTLETGSTELRRKISVKRYQDVNLSGVRTLKFETFLFKLPGVIVGDEADCTVDMPGPIVANNVLRPRLPYTEAKAIYNTRRTAPDFDMGIVVLQNERENLTLSIWHETLKTCYSFHIAGDGQSVTIAHNEQYANYIYDYCDFTSHENVIRLSEKGISEALQKYAAYIQQVSPPKPEVPAWVKEAVILEVDTLYYGGFKSLQEKLAWLKDLGFNTLYLMPVNQGSYLVADHYSIDPALGTIEDLKVMVANAHHLGMRVLLDLLISIMTPDSQVVREHPDYFQRNEAGQICPHFKWDNAATDYANPAFRHYITDFATFCVREYGIDGFRVDDPCANTPNWYPHSGREPWETTMGAYTLLGEVHLAIKAVNPEAILLTELGGPALYHVSDISHNFGFVHQLLWEKVKAQGYNVQDYKNLLADMQDVLPPKALRVFYTRNHDSWWFAGFDGYSPEFHCYEAVHCLIKGIPLMFSGQDKWPGPTETDFAFYRKLFALRRQHNILIEGDCLYHAIDVDDDRVFSVIRRLNDEVMIVLVNTCQEVVKVHVNTVKESLPSLEGPFSIVDVYGGKDLRVDTLDMFALNIEPYGIRVFKVKKSA
jgi:glycosidase